MRLTGREAGHHYCLLGQRQEDREKNQSSSSFRGQGKENLSHKTFFKGLSWLHPKSPACSISKNLYWAVSFGVGGRSLDTIHVPRLVGTAVFPSELKVCLPLLVPLYYGIPDMSMTQDTTRQMDSEGALGTISILEMHYPSWISFLIFGLSINRMSNISFLVPNITSVNSILKIQWGTITGFKAREKCDKIRALGSWTWPCCGKKAQKGLCGGERDHGWDEQVC